jgi:hypothetical protein
MRRRLASRGEMLSTCGLAGYLGEFTGRRKWNDFVVVGLVRVDEGCSMVSDGTTGSSSTVSEMGPGISTQTCMYCNELGPSGMCLMSRVQVEDRRLCWGKRGRQAGRHECQVGQLAVGSNDLGTGERKAWKPKWVVGRMPVLSGSQPERVRGAAGVGDSISPTLTRVLPRPWAPPAWIFF